MNSPKLGRRKTIIGLFGAGGFGREIMPLLIQSPKSNFGYSALRRQYYFIESETSLELVNGVSVLSEEEFFQKQNFKKFFNVAIADSQIRRKVSERAFLAGATPVNIISPKAVVHETVTLGEGAIITDFVTITSNVEIGNFFHANLYSYIAHDCKIGNYVTFAPGVACNGNVIIEDNVFVGANAVIRPGSVGRPRVIGSGAIIGMGAVVLNDIAPNTTVVGNPARRI